ncbi:anthranilate synthase component II [Aquibacillus saliphilus]|uniref:anthranilate synthase component II n=1 Tax=Aquibacillus saliphilus TaxID=1909422 RepID=UPI001CF08521|nr:aminodeoxychorismate/anthranilate synthase component II [Aquibacillus saliphilus]
MIVIIDNYDSFTYNLVQYYKELDSIVHVFRNDQLTSQQLQQLNPDLIVFSPGPGTPDDTGVCRDILSTFHKNTPILGVCLGYQLIVDFFGGQIVKSNQPMHGKLSLIHHTNQGVFESITSPLKVTRYHSLIADIKHIPTSLDVTSHTLDGVIMGVRHHKYPVEGIQFHPESILTDYGFTMIENSYKQALAWNPVYNNGAGAGRD